MATRKRKVKFTTKVKKFVKEHGLSLALGAAVATAAFVLFK